MLELSLRRFVIADAKFDNLLMQSTGNSLEGAFGGYDDVRMILLSLFFLKLSSRACLQSGLYGNNSNYNAEDTIGDDYDGDLRPRAVWQPVGI